MGMLNIQEDTKSYSKFLLLVSFDNYYCYTPIFKYSVLFKLFLWGMTGIAYSKSCLLDYFICISLSA